MIHSINIEKFRLFQNQEFKLGKRITIIAGHNAVGKSTLLGLLGNIVEYKAKNIFGKKFRTEFSEIFKASPEFDKTGEHKGKINFCTIGDFSTINYSASFRSTWQNNNTRFRIIPDRIDKNGDKTAAKYEMPVIYLGLSRLYPLGETVGDPEKDELKLSNKEKEWFLKYYSYILSISDKINEITSMRTQEVKSNFTGINTAKYDALCNSAGQDNLGQILLGIISFKRLKEKIKKWEGGLYIVDEIDSTLHPAAQQRLIDFLFREAKAIDLQIIFTSHSLSIMKLISKKYEENSRFSDDYKLIFISNANNEIKVYHNPSYELIKNNLCLTLSPTNVADEKILVYSEDDDTRWFFKKLIHGYANKLKFINANLGCSDLERLLKEDPNYFSKVLFVVDGDVKISSKSFVKKSNVLALIGEKRPENLLYDYLNDDDCDFWTNKLETQGMTRKYFIVDNGPFSIKYDHYTKERKKFSSWFFEKKDEIVKYKVFNSWKRANISEVKEFRDEFVKVYNRLAEKRGIPIIGLSE